VIALLVASLAAILAFVAIGMNLSEPTPQIQPAVQQNLPAGGESAGGHVAINLYDCAGPPCPDGCPAGRWPGQSKWTDCCSRL
jgi:hypothetical protein